MKKILRLLAFIIVLVIVFTLWIFIKPNISRTCKIKELDISLKIPYAYQETYNESENVLLNMYNSEGIRISVVELKDNFWSSGDTEARMNEYLNVISAMNYDSEIKNIKKEILKKKDGNLAKVELTLRNPSGNAKKVSVIANEKIGNFVIEIEGSMSVMENKAKEIEKIIKSIKT